MPETLLSRPELILSLPVTEFETGTWRKDELIAFAKVLGVPMKGTKAAVTARIRTQLLRRNPPTESVANDAAETRRRTSTCTPVETIAVEAPSPATPAALPLVVTSPAPASAPLPTASPMPADFFRAEPGQSRAQALAAWFASRKAKG